MCRTTQLMTVLLSISMDMISSLQAAMLDRTRYASFRRSAGVPGMSNRVMAYRMGDLSSVSTFRLGPDVMLTTTRIDGITRLSFPVLYRVG
jgi:hypothetical protein